jgi:hypothetical protein
MPALLPLALRSPYHSSAVHHTVAVCAIHGRVQVTDHTLRALREKYLEIKRLRVLAQTGSEPDPRSDMAALAQRFPGALRELDALPMPEIERRLSLLDAVVDRSAQVPRWVQLQISYHGLMRAALRIKRIAAGRDRNDVERVLAELSERYRAEPDEPELASFDHAALEAILEPAAGRLNPWVFARLALLHGMSAEDVRDAVFPR